VHHPFSGERAFWPPMACSVFRNLFFQGFSPVFKRPSTSTVSEVLEFVFYSPPKPANLLSVPPIDLSDVSHCYLQTSFLNKRFHPFIGLVRRYRCQFFCDVL